MNKELWKKWYVLCRRTVFGVLFAVTVSGVTACSGGGESKQVAVPELKIEKAASVTNGTPKGDSGVIGVGNTSVSYDEYRVYRWFLRNQYAGILSEDVWNYKIENATIGQEAVEDVLRLIIQIKVTNKAAAEQGISLGVDEKGDIDYKADQYLATISEEIRQANGINAEILHRIFEENEVARKMYDVTTTQTQMERQQVQAAKVLMLYLPADEASREQVRGEANVLAAELSQYSGNFTSFVKDKTGKKPEETIIGSLDGRVNLVNNVLGMKRNTISSVIEETDGFYIVQCLKVNTDGLNDAYWDQYVTEQQTKSFQTAYENWAAKYEVKVSKSLLTQ